MQLLIIRHAIAEDREAFALSGKPDEQRPLTDKGMSKMRKNAKGIKRLMPELHLIFHSPLLRAAQTAEIISDTYPKAQQDTLQSLAPMGDANSVLNALQELPHGQCVALVGHEPELGYLTSYFLSGQQGEWMPLKKGSAVLLTFEHNEILAGRAILQWAVTPAQLRRIAS